MTLNHSAFGTLDCKENAAQIYECFWKICLIKRLFNQSDSSRWGIYLHPPVLLQYLSVVWTIAFVDKNAMHLAIFRSIILSQQSPRFTEQTIEEMDITERRYILSVSTTDNSKVTEKTENHRISESICRAVTQRLRRQARHLEMMTHFLISMKCCPLSSSCMIVVRDITFFYFKQFIPA